MTEQNKIGQFNHEHKCYMEFLGKWYDKKAAMPAMPAMPAMQAMHVYVTLSYIRSMSNW